MARPIWALLVASLMVAPGAALAQAAAPAGPDQVVNTAPSGPTAPPKAAPNGQVASVADATEEDAEDDGPVRDNRVHGEISVGAGTNGYREVSGVATVPVGETGQATIAVDSEQMNYHR